MYLAAGVIALLLALGLLWLIATVEDWSRDLTTNYAATSVSAKNPSLHPITSQRPSSDLADLAATAVKRLPGWELAGREVTADEITLRFVRTTRLLRFKDDITVHIRLASDNQQPAQYEVFAESQSRVGKGDFGQNPRNLAELMDTLRTLLR